VNEVAAPSQEGSGSGASQSPERGQRREPRAEEDSRLAGVPARRYALQTSVGKRKPREARLKAVAAPDASRGNLTQVRLMKVRSDGPCSDAPRVVQQRGRRGLRSRVNTPGPHRKVWPRALSTTKRLPVGPLRGRSRGRIHVARRGSGSTKRSVARASYRRKAHPDRPLARPLHGGIG